MGDPNPNPDPNPKPADPPADPPKPDPKPPADPPKGGGDGKGGKAAILADLAKERDARQALEQQVKDLQASQQTQLDGIAKALGLKTDNTPPDPAKLTEQLTAEQSRAREAAVQLAVYRNAAANGANPDALLDSASFLRSVDKADPTDTEAVSTAIKAAVEANPLLKAAPAAGPQPPKPDPTQGRGPGGVPLDSRAADLAQIEADLAAAKRG